MGREIVNGSCVVNVVKWWRKWDCVSLCTAVLVRFSRDTQVVVKESD